MNKRITFRGMDHSAPMEEYANQQLAKVEKFLVVSGEAAVRFRKIDEDEVIEYNVTGDEPTVVDIPVGYTHSITNTSKTKELITIIWANELFDEKRPDTYFLEV